MTYKEKFQKALLCAKTLEDFDYILGKLETTNQINRRTIKGRELTQELQGLWRETRGEAIKKYNLQPF